MLSQDRRKGDTQRGLTVTPVRQQRTRRRPQGMLRTRMLTAIPIRARMSMPTLGRMCTVIPTTTAAIDSSQGKQNHFMAGPKAPPFVLLYT
jgi:hypothetical protein